MGLVWPKPLARMRLPSTPNSSSIALTEKARFVLRASLSFALPTLSVCPSKIVSKAALENYTEQLIEFLKVEKIDLIILAGFLLKIPEAFIKAFPNKIINLHPALLPKYGGAGMYGHHVHKAVLANKEKESGITIHFVNEEYDKGEVILQASTLIEESETPESLAKKIQLLEFEHLPKAVERFL